MGEFSVALVALSGKNLNVTISVNGIEVKLFENTNPFYKILARNKDNILNEYYTSDLVSIIERT